MRNDNLLVTLGGQSFNPYNYDMDENSDAAVLNNRAPLNVVSSNTENIN